MGSPPHTRGIYGHLISGFYCHRLTPAYAGNICINLLSSDTLRAHPRIRGEYSRIASEASSSLGSPPHTRGICYVTLLTEGSHGLTPAYAGNMNPVATLKAELEAHPRIRGEYSRISEILLSSEGPPPHTRGILIRHLLVWHFRRLTPADAGKIFICGTRWLPSGAHPRIRGEYLSAGPSDCHSSGSPPHTRGIFQRCTDAI